MINIDVFTPSKSEEFDSNTSPWEDEETRQFYECIPDLKSLIPGILYKDTTTNQQKDNNKQMEDQQSAANSNNQSTEDISIEIEKIEKEIQQLEIESNSVDDLDTQTVSVDLNLPDDKEDLIAEEINSTQVNNNNNNTSTTTTTPLNTTTTTTTTNQTSLSGANMKALMDSFVNQLPNCVNRELIDKAAKEFCMNLNTKSNRKRLVRGLFEVQRTRLDLLPFYSRFVATLHAIMPEISTELSSLLLNDFRFHVRKKDQINIESKIKVSRFIGELVKFNMFSKFEALNCLKSLLVDFRHHNIEMYCNLLDVCGRYLYRNPETHMKLKLLLEISMRKKQAAMSMDNRYTIMIENVFYYCNPPENKQVEKRLDHLYMNT